MVPTSGFRIGVDLGGTKIEAIALDGLGRECAWRRIATPADDYEATVGAVVDLVARIERELGASASVGVAIPGTVSPATGLVKNANSVWLIGHALDRDLAAALSRPVRLANDANCFANSEATDGAAAGADVVFGVIVGTGTGGGIVANGKVVRGNNAVAGEWGHNPLPWPEGDEWPGPDCYCGKTGCIETFLSGPGFTRDHRTVTGEDDSPAEIARKAAAEEPAAAQSLARYVRRMAKALASVINILDPDVIVLGGGISNIEPIYEAVPRSWGEYAFSDRVTTRLVRAKHGDSSGVRGAAWLWPPEGAAGP